MSTARTYPPSWSTHKIAEYEAGIGLDKVFDDALAKSWKDTEIGVKHYDEPIDLSKIEVPPEYCHDPGCHNPVDHPAHYTSHPSGIECIEITRWMGFNLGNAIKYLWRADLKGEDIQDLEKAAWYIKDEIEKRNTVTTELSHDP